MVKYCPECGTKTELRQAFGKERPVCPKCDQVYFDDPKVAVGVVVAIDGRIVLGKRNHDPKLGYWSFPSGFVDVGEVLEDAAAREVEEETGLKVQIERLLGVYSTQGERTIFVAYAGSVIGGELVAGEECSEVGTFAPEALPEMAFPHDGEILDAWANGGIALQPSGQPSTS